MLSGYTAILAGLSHHFSIRRGEVDGEHWTHRRRNGCGARAGVRARSGVAVDGVLVGGLRSCPTPTSSDSASASATPKWGHRGATHSLVASIAAGILIGLAARCSSSRLSYGDYRDGRAGQSRGLDTMTDGGLGCALFWPFDLTRYFAPGARFRSRRSGSASSRPAAP